MIHLERLIDRIIRRVNVNLRNPLLDVSPYVRGLIPSKSHAQYYAFYSLDSERTNLFKFKGSSLAGTYFLGKCEVLDSVLYKSDIRGDELKSKGDVVEMSGIKIPLRDDEKFHIRDSFLMKTLVHCHSKDPQNPELFKVHNTVALHYANIHGSSLNGTFLAPFSTIDLSVAHDCAIGEFSYVQAGELLHKRIEPGRIWIKAEGAFEWDYQYPEGVLDKYISMDESGRPSGEFMKFLEERKEDFIPMYATVSFEHEIDIPESSKVSPYALVRGDVTVAENVLVAQRSWVEDSHLGKGANAQENCYIINSHYEGNNVTAHGGKVINCRMGTNTFVGFNCFLRGLEEAPVKVGNGCIVMPHTIIDAAEPLEIPEDHLVWGFITCTQDLETNSMALADFAKLKGQFSLGNMTFEGIGSKFVEGFAHRVEHILELNGAFYDGTPETSGHAQNNRRVSYSILMPFTQGEKQGLCPSLSIEPFTPEND
ncbi:hypothetical protein [Desulfovibrio oxyclinae]|jgi:carbonic anhydrase/acetyltransferase-like protein (isoleucine patch superfamily)|uniref:hypothetical protein n=1 Tax=Desulfovibrio oxyclinae TaxID=63560 RepID=UPI000376125E|nr:hypothetical protein [Desulfovibrio oxyclinae]